MDNNALLLTGGGARAAYQVGVLKAIASFLPRNQGLPFPIICGTSAGAINATALACYASCYHLGVKKLEYVWKNFHSNQVYKAHAKDLYGRLVGNFFTDRETEASSLLNNKPLRALLSKVVDFHRIDSNLVSGHLKAISVTASSYSNGNSISFFQSNSEEHQSWQRAKRQGVKSLINVDHLMASAAIPLIFPSVKIKGEFFGDGSIHQLSPTSPAIHLGAKKILIIGLEQPEPKGYDCYRYPSNGVIAGHLLDTIFADTLNSDLERLERVNQTIQLLSEKQRVETHLREINTLCLNPSENFADIASKHYASMPLATRQLLKLTGMGAQSDSSLISYLMFEKPFCQELIDLGYRDGMDNLTTVKNFLL